MSRKYKMNNDEAIYFISYAVVDWVDVLTRPRYKEIVIKSLVYCIQNKGLRVHAYAIMSNHVHLIISRTDDGQKLSSIVRDFKKFTASAILKEIKNNHSESRKTWMLALFERQGKKNANNTTYQFWRQDNRPIMLYSPNVIRQKIDYIHNNPVIEGWVYHPSDYVYSSASVYMNEDRNVKLPLELLDTYYSFDS